MATVDIPPYFLCPISLQIMRDPVTLPTGISYDRDSIERWLSFPAGEREHLRPCPVTKQPLSPDAEMTPNHTLRRLIQAWCVANAASGVERFPTPRSPVDKAHIARLLEEASRQPESHLTCLRQLRSIVSESERNRRSAEAAGAPDFLLSIIKGSGSASGNAAAASGGVGGCEEALGVLCALKVSGVRLRELVGPGAELVKHLTAVLQKSTSSPQSRACAIYLLQFAVEAAVPARLITLEEELFVEVVRVVRDQLSNKATKTALRILALLCSWGRNRVKGAKAGAVSAVLDLLLDDSDQKLCEMALVVLDLLCGCAEGRAELVAHAAGLAVVTKKVLRVSPMATERAVRVLHSVSRSCPTAAVLQEMMQASAVTKLCLLVQMDGEAKTKEKAMEVLRLHARTWKNSPCLPAQLLPLFPRH